VAWSAELPSWVRVSLVGRIFGYLGGERSCWPHLALIVVHSDSVMCLDGRLDVVAKGRRLACQKCVATDTQMLVLERSEPFSRRSSFVVAGDAAGGMGGANCLDHRRPPRRSVARRFAAASTAFPRKTLLIFLVTRGVKVVDILLGNLFGIGGFSGIGGFYDLDYCAKAGQFLLQRSFRLASVLIRVVRVAGRSQLNWVVDGSLCPATLLAMLATIGFGWQMPSATSDVLLLRVTHPRFPLLLSDQAAINGWSSILGHAFVARLFSLRLSTTAPTRLLVIAQRSLARPSPAVHPGLWLSLVSTMSAHALLSGALRWLNSSRHRWPRIGVHRLSHSTIGS
jgi:hypothetical protein